MKNEITGVKLHMSGIDSALLALTSLRDKWFTRGRMIKYALGVIVTLVLLPMIGGLIEHWIENHWMDKKDVRMATPANAVARLN